MARRFHYATAKDHGNGWVTQTEHVGAARWYLAHQEDTDGYTVPGTARRFGYARDALAYVESRKHEPQPIAQPRELSPVAEQIRQLLDKLPQR